MMKKELLSIILIFIVVLGIFGFYLLKFQPKSQQLIEQMHTEKETQPRYRYVTKKPTGWFKTGQEADIVLYATGFNESGGPLVLDHPGKVATDGKRLIVSDTWNNRVLIWNKIPTKNNEPPDLVLGQPDFNSNIARLGADGMNWPMGVATDGERLLVADTYNNRILIWKEFPTKNGQPADLVLGVNDFNTRISEYGDRDKRTYIDWPWDVWTDGEKVITSGGPVLIWNTFPTKNNQPADIVLGVNDFSERFGAGKEYMPGPTGIASDGKRLALGTYEPKGIYIYNKFPIQSGEKPDFFLPLENWGAMGLALQDDRLFAVSHSRFFIWNFFPTSSKQQPDIVYESWRAREKILLRPDKEVLYPDQISYAYGIAATSDKLIVADTNNNRILIFNEIPTKAGEKADVMLGKPEIFVSRSSFGSGPMPFSDGEHLFVGVDGFGVWIYNKLPDESKAEADVVIGKLLGNIVVGGHAISDGNKLIMVYREGSNVFIWNEIPKKDNELPDVILGKDARLDDRGKPGLGKIAMNGPQRAATDGKSLFVTDTGNNRVLIWNKIPIKNQTEADFVLGQKDFESSDSGNKPNQLNHPVGISTDGKYLAVADVENQRILIWKLPITENQQMPDLILKDWKLKDGGEMEHFNLPQDVSIYDDKLFVADCGFNRVLIWSKFPQTEDAPPDIVLGQKDFYSSVPSNTKDGLKLPCSLNFDGSFLWVGEVKYSQRLLRFSVQPLE